MLFGGLFGRLLQVEDPLLVEVAGGQVVAHKALVVDQSAGGLRFRAAELLDFCVNLVALADFLLHCAL